MGAAAAPCALFAIGLFLSDKSIKSGFAEGRGLRHRGQAPAAAAGGAADPAVLRADRLGCG